MHKNDGFGAKSDGLTTDLMLEMMLKMVGFMLNLMMYMQAELATAAANDAVKSEALVAQVRDLVATMTFWVTLFLDTFWFKCCHTLGLFWS